MARVGGIRSFQMGITALSKAIFIATAWDWVGRKIAKAQLLGDIYETARSRSACRCRLMLPR